MTPKQLKEIGYTHITQCLNDIIVYKIDKCDKCKKTVIGPNAIVLKNRVVSDFTKIGFVRFHKIPSDIYPDDNSGNYLCGDCTTG